MKISSVHARQIFDSRGFPTVECDVTLDDGSMGRAAVPSGASTGSGEALELRDGGQEYGGKGVSKAVNNIHQVIAPAIIGYEAWDQFAIDDMMCELDGTENKTKLGANAILAVSLAVAKAAAISSGKPLYAHIADIAGVKEFSIPMPMLNIFNGGQHASGSTDIQEFMIIPIGADNFTSALRMASEIFHNLGKVLKDHDYSTTVGDEGGYAPSVKGGTDEALHLIEEAIDKSGYVAGRDVGLAIDVAASELEQNGQYNFARAGIMFNSDELIDSYGELSKKHSILSIEDGLSETDWSGWHHLQETLGDRIQIVGDDLFVTNSKLLQKGIGQGSANAILIKPNQIGTLTETIRTVQMAQSAGWRTIVSHRSGETEDTTIAHLAVGLNVGQIKTGSFSRSERIAKYNELIRIQELLPDAPLARPFGDL